MQPPYMEAHMVYSYDTYQDADGNVWAFDPPYEDDEDLGYFPGEED